jgi:hypothetical protein
MFVLLVAKLLEQRVAQFEDGSPGFGTVLRSHANNPGWKGGQHNILVQEDHSSGIVSVVKHPTQSNSLILGSVTIVDGSLDAATPSEIAGCAKNSERKRRISH